VCVYVYIWICNRVRDGEGVSHFPREGGFASKKNKKNALACNLSDDSVSSALNVKALLPAMPCQY